MRIIQLLPTISFGDAVGNDTRAIHKILEELGYGTRIYAENIDPRLPRGTAYPVDEIPTLDPNDVIIYHASTGTDLNYRLPSYPSRKILVYHNITPPEFFAPYSPAAEQLTTDGLNGIRYLADKVDYCIADSDFNKQDLLRMGYACPIDVCPIVIPFSDYDARPDAGVLSRYRGDGFTNLLFVGRIAPNKKQEDVIAAFYYYHKYYNSRSRLFLVGSYSGMERYYEQLCAYIDELGLRDSVIFPGHIKFAEILAYYSIADVFVCMSEHEGFCVPLVEAMYFNVPIVAYRCAAVPFTMGDQGMLLESKEPAFVAAVIDRVISSAALREKLEGMQKIRQQEYNYENVRDKFSFLLDRFLKNKLSRKPRLVQLTSTISRGDAVSNDIIAFQNAFIKMGYSAPIYTEVKPTGSGWDNVCELGKLKDLSEHDVVLYHHATGTRLAAFFSKLKCKKILVYHNVTPPSFFAPFDKNAENSCKWGLENLQEMSSCVNGCIADSEFNKNDLLNEGYTKPIEVCPILVPFSDYEQEPDQDLLKELRKEKENIIFVGRVAPNKKFEDIIAAFSEYKKINRNAKLHLVGTYDEQESYYQFLIRFIKKLDVEDVYFTGHISFPKILSYYHAANLFLCMSEHEGFCVPLIEAMYFNVPIIAFRSTAIPETLGGAGILLEDKQPEIVAAEMEKLLSDRKLREEILKRQRDRLQFFSYESVNKILKDTILKIVGGTDEG